MTQLELFENEPLKPIQRYLHVWTEAQRARAKKNPAPGRLGTVQGEKPVKAKESPK